MKRLRIKSWVKVVLVILVVLAFIIALVMENDNYMEDCINAGYSREYCEMGR